MASPSSHPDPTGPGGSSRTPPVQNVGEPCAGEPHARFDGRELETEHPDHGHRGGAPDRETGGTQALGPTASRCHRANSRPNQPPTAPALPVADDSVADDSVPMTQPPALWISTGAGRGAMTAPGA